MVAPVDPASGGIDGTSDDVTTAARVRARSGHGQGVVEIRRRDQEEPADVLDLRQAGRGRDRRHAGQPLTGHEAARLTESDRPRTVLVDQRGFLVGGYAGRAAVQEQQEARVTMLSSHGSVDAVLRPIASPVTKSTTAAAA